MNNSAVFLDRDGTIIVEKNYISDPNEVVLLDGVTEGLRLLKAVGLRLVVVSNQSGIGRGYFTMSEAQVVNSRVNALLRDEGAEIADWYICPHPPDVGCRCRKPEPGMIEKASRELGLDPRRSFVIGDKHTDLELATAVGARGILVTTGYGASEVKYARNCGAAVCSSILEASRLIATDLEGP
jgi:D-glycero-D-manno-heptose 1,7-bisphosphate phosphatase